MSYNKVNNLTGWMVCLIACTVYLKTMEATGSFWDTGEFLSTAYKLQIPHPPGAPFFTLLGRCFVILFGDNPATAAIAVNSMSAMASGFTILFLFWTITHFARKLVVPAKGQASREQTFTIMAAGAVGSLAYTFSDSFWYSAVESEVYALSSLFTAVVFWAILKWEREVDIETEAAGRRQAFSHADRWLVFICFLMGLSIGVHLLNLLTIPAIVMVYYFKRFKATRFGALKALLAGCVITGFVQKFLIQYTVDAAGWMDIRFVNGLGLPFFSGFAVSFILLAAFLTWLHRLATRKNYAHLKLGIWGIAFMLLGYSTYLTTLIRSNANPAVDMFNVDNPVSLSGYLSREQYADWPIVYGPDFTERPLLNQDADVMVKGKEKYEPAGKIIKQEWGKASSAHFFPRMWDYSDDRQQQYCYQQFTGLTEGESPTMGDNLRYFANYQAGWMYMRYFMWNFSGRQNDLQGFGNVRDSNWISGIPLIDKAMYGSQDKMPDSVHLDNKAYNRLYMLPLLLGFAGIILHYRRSRQDFLVGLSLFFFTGLAIVIYLNQSGYQPRERDYAYVGSFYAFAIWIGLGMIWVRQMLSRVVKRPVSSYLAAGLCILAVPLLMALEEWDDHDRSRKTLARDMARNYLESCPKNAILISFEDNDTYPLWYAQEVEGIRPDVRVIVNTLMGSDWYMKQLRYKINESSPFDIVFSDEQVQGSRRNVVYYKPLPGYDQSTYYDLHQVLKNVVGSDNPANTAQLEDGETVNLFPVRKFSVPVDAQFVEGNGTVNPGDRVVKELHLDLPERGYLFKNDLALLAIIAANKWERPVCFTSTSQLGELGLEKYVRMEGLSYRLVPVENPGVDNTRAYENITQKFGYGDTRGMYFDEENRRRLNIMRLAHAQVAISLAEAGRKTEAQQVLDKFTVRPSDLPYGMTSNRGNQHNAISMQLLKACYMSGATRLAKEIHASVKRDLRQQLSYYQSLDEEIGDETQLVNNAYQLFQGNESNLGSRQVSFAQDILSSYQLLRQLDEWEKEAL